MRMRGTWAALLGVALMSGCAGVNGTWTSAGGTDPAKNPIARVTFANDGTFTAEADYGPHGKQAMSGYWCMCGGKLHLDADGKKRDYPVEVKGDEMTIGEHKAKMQRMKGKGCCCM
ncbi:MAG: hypothetical protein U1A27_02450 [Phycisphaerae bacterium]